MNDPSLKKFAKIIVTRLREHFPEVKCHLEFKTPFELLISTILAAQCTDLRVNLVMTPLYRSKYKSPDDIIKDGEENFRSNIRSINFYNNKARNAVEVCKKLINEYNGKVPDEIDELVKLPGVGRKTASVVTGNCYRKNDVIIVDTHLKRVSARLGLIKADDPDKIELELKEIIPADEQFKFSMRTGELGRQICKARKPDCENCFLNDICPSAFKV
ncbi:MAG: endonuclease III [bacterium]|nr:endonuclease III [bacterium]